ncbi:hypothetical protein ES708_31752 [subsurface metagenome]
MGGKLPPHAPGKAEKMVEGLDQHPSKLVLLAEYKGEFAGLSTSFINYGTFSVKPFINIHDIVVLSRVLFHRIVCRKANHASLLCWF